MDIPLYEMGITGIFTKSLDLALLREQVDVAVHSLKDVPTQLPNGLATFAILQREDPLDLAVTRADKDYPADAVVATGSLRRQAQWLRRHPDHRIVDLRGNVQTRLAKLESGDWTAALFAAAGLKRMEIKPRFFEELHWMIPAPAQGAVTVVGREADLEKYRTVYAGLNHRETRTCVELERAFLRSLEGGCTAPIGAYARIIDGRVHFRGGLFSEDGSQAVEIEKIVAQVEDLAELAHIWANEVREKGGREILNGLKR